MQQLRLAVADDNPEILEIVSELVSSEFCVVGLFEDGRSVLRQTPDLKPDIIILDISLGDCCGFDIAKKLSSVGCNATILFLTVYEDEEFIKASFEAGGSAYVIKRRLQTDLLPALRAVMNHEIFVSGINGRDHDSIKN